MAARMVADPVCEELAAACAAAGIEGPGAFRARYGIAPADLTAGAALALVTLPGWLFDVWLPNAGRHGIVAYIPAAVAAYGRIVGVVPRVGETPHEYNGRLQARWQEGVSHE